MITAALFRLGVAAPRPLRVVTESDSLSFTAAGVAPANLGQLFWFRDVPASSHTLPSGLNLDLVVVV